MVHDSNRRALRNSLPLLLGGFLLLALAAALISVPAADVLRPLTARLHLATIATVCGALGSGLMLVGAAQLAQARIAGRYSFSLLAFFALWLGEFVTRAWMLATPGEHYDLLLLRLILAGSAMIALASGMIWIWDRNEPPARLATWRRTRGLFLLQLVITPLLALLDGGPGSGAANWTAVLWLLFAVPYAHLFVSLRRSVAWVSRRESVAELLTS